MSGLVIGIGNRLRGDDGWGSLLAERIAQTPWGQHARVHCCHQLTPELAELISEVDLVVFLDARLDHEVGTLRCQLVEPADDVAAAFTHQVDPATLLAYAERLFSRRPLAFQVSIAGVAFGPEERLSPLVEASLPTAVAQVEELFERVGGQLAAAPVSHA